MPRLVGRREEVLDSGDGLLGLDSLLNGRMNERVTLLYKVTVGRGRRYRTLQMTIRDEVIILMNRRAAWWHSTPNLEGWESGIGNIV